MKEYSRGAEVQEIVEFIDDFVKKNEVQIIKFHSKMSKKNVIKVNGTIYLLGDIITLFKNICNDKYKYENPHIYHRFYYQLCSIL